MATMQREEILRTRGEDLYDSDGEKIGTIEQIYVDTETQEPEWALVKAGLFGTKSTFVPIREASQEGSGGLRVPYDKALIKDAPKMDPDGELSQSEEAELYRHYGLRYSEAGSGSGLPESGAGTTMGGAPAGGRFDTTTEDDAGTGGSGDAMTRSEEELQVDKADRERGRVRLRKYVETEDVQQTVPVRREEVRVEREPITDDNRDEALAGPEISEDEHAITLHEEEVVAEKRTVPKERVRLEKDTVTDEREVSETVRKEQIDVDDSERGGR